MTEQDLEIQKLRRLLLHAIEDLMVAMADNPCRVCKYADADCEPGTCVPEWRGLEEMGNKE